MEKHEAISDVVADLVNEWAVPEAAALAEVQRFADSGDCNGYETLADAVTENTSYVVAEWMIHEAYFA